MKSSIKSAKTKVNCGSNARFSRIKFGIDYVASEKQIQST